MSLQTRSPAVTPSRSVPAADTASFEEQVREYAYRIYLSRLREGVPGDAASDWLRAEQELRRRLPRQAA